LFGYLTEITFFFWKHISETQKWIIMDNILILSGKWIPYSFTNQSLLTGRGGGTIKPEAFLKHGELAGLDGCNVFMHDSQTKDFRVYLPAPAYTSI